MSLREATGTAEAAVREPDVSARGLARMAWALAIPILFVEIGETIIDVTDVVFVARVGTTELAALALGNVALDLAAVPVIGLAEAMQVVIARRFGQRRERAIGTTFVRSLALVFVLSVLVAALLLLLAGPIAGLVAGSGPVATELERFLKIGAVGLVPFSLNLVYASLYVGLAAARVLVGATLALTFTNVVVGYALVFGALGFPALGLRGAALAFVAAEVVALLYLAAHTVRRLDRGRFGLAGRVEPDARAMRSLVRVGGPMAGQVAIESLRWLVFFLILARVSETALASSNIVYACYALFLVPATAFGEAAYSLVSNAIGGGRPDRIRWLTRRLVVAALLVTIPFVQLTLAFPDAVTALFTPDEAVVGETLTTLAIVGAAIVVIVPADLWLAALFGTGDSDAAAVIEAVATSAMLAFAAVAALVLGLDLEYVWLGLPLASLVTLAAAYGWMRSGRWRRRVI